jgi:hypothetical protein
LTNHFTSFSFCGTKSDNDTQDTVPKNNLKNLSVVDVIADRQKSRVIY